MGPDFGHGLHLVVIIHRVLRAGGADAAGALQSLTFWRPEHLLQVRVLGPTLSATPSVVETRQIRPQTCKMQRQKQVRADMLDLVLRPLFRKQCPCTVMDLHVLHSGPLDACDGTHA